MDIVGRAWNIIVHPIAEWRAIDDEPSTPAEILKGYVAILAAIPAVCGFIGGSIVGVGFYRVPFFLGLASAILHYVLTLAAVFVLAFVINAVAPMCGGTRNFSRAFKIAAYAPTPLWVAGVFALAPALAVFMILGVYSAYLFFVGAPLLMRTRVDSSVAYVLVVLVAAIIAAMAILFIPARLFGIA